MARLRPSTVCRSMLFGIVLLFAPMSQAQELTPSAQQCFDEAFYLQSNPDVAAAVNGGSMPSGRVHFDAFGRKEGRRSCPPRQFVRLPLAARVVLLAAALAGVLALSWRKRIGTAATAVGLAFPIALFACFDYVVGNRVFVFFDIASDTRNQFWPTMTYLARHIRRGELPMWNFGIGLGQNMFPDWLTDPFAVVAILTGERALPYALGPLHVLKVVL